MLLTTFYGSDRAGLGGQQDGHVALIGHGGNAFEHVGQPDFEVVAVAFGALDQGVDDGGALAGGLAADEQPVLFSNSGGPDAVFYQIIVNLDLAVDEEKTQAVPEGEGVVDGSAEFPFGQDLGVLAQGKEFALEDSEDGGTVVFRRGRAEESRRRAAGATVPSHFLDKPRLRSMILIGQQKLLAERDTSNSITTRKTNIWLTSKLTRNNGTQLPKKNKRKSLTD